MMYKSQFLKIDTYDCFCGPYDKHARTQTQKQVFEMEEEERWPLTPESQQESDR